MNRLDAKFIAAMFNNNPVAFLEHTGALMPPLEKLTAVKKAIVGNDLDMPQEFESFKAF